VSYPAPLSRSVLVQEERVQGFVEIVLADRSSGPLAAVLALFMVSEPRPSASEFLPKRRALESLRAAARACKGCDLYKYATQTVFGEGAKDAGIVLVGEQPGDMEDREGRPFVGPAGRLLDKALAEARIARDEIYITNAVKHFRWIQRGKKRLHQKPTIRQVTACKPWLDSELEVIRPKVVVCLGATAAQSVLHRAVSIGRERGRFFDGERGEAVFVTIHPSSIFRRRGKNERDEEYRRLVAEMKLVRRKLRGSAAA
jgi:uracil-DNA glycosylase family protein